MKQTKLDDKLQLRVQQIAARQYPNEAPEIELPLIIALPAGIHPYNRASGYFDPEANAFVAYQKLGRRIRSTAESERLDSFIQHEMAHWYQHRVLRYVSTSSVNVHRHRTWKEACYVATKNLWPEYKLELWQFSPTTTKRVNGKPVTIPRPGAITDTELHHWPSSLPSFLKRIRNEQAQAA